MDAFNDYYEKIISTTEIIKQPIQDTFKLPIQYNKHKTLDNSLLEDIELCGNNNKYNCILNNKENFNLLIDDYSKYYNKNGLNYNFYTQAKSYVDALKKKTQPFIKIQDGINSVLVVDAIYKSININKVIKLKY